MVNGEFHSVEKAFDMYIPEGPRKEVKRILYGTNSEAIPLNEKAINIARENNFEIAGYRIKAEKEQTRLPKLVKIGAVQNIYKSATTAPI